MSRVPGTQLIAPLQSAASPHCSFQHNTRARKSGLLHNKLVDEADLEEGEEAAELVHLGDPLLGGLQGRSLPQGRLKVPGHRAETGEMC